MRLSKFATLAVLASAVVLGRAAAAEHPCAAAVDGRLTESNIDRSKVTGIGYMPRTSASTRGIRVLGIDAWIAFSSCAGSLVVKMKPNCTIQEVYSTGACTLGGLARP